MKTLLVIPLLALSIQIASAQGLVSFQNNNATRVVNGLTGEPLPVGPEFLVGLYYGDDGVMDDSQYVQIGSTIMINVRAGVFAGGNLLAPTREPGGWGMFQVRVWEAAFGTTYDEAVAADPQGGRRALAGKSNMIRVLTANPNSMKPASFLTGHGLQGFEVHPVPEPSILLLIGAALIPRLAAWRLKRSCIPSSQVANLRKDYPVYENTPRHSSFGTEHSHWECAGSCDF